LHAELNSKSQHSNYWLNDTDSLGTHKLAIWCMDVGWKKVRGLPVHIFSFTMGWSLG